MDALVPASGASAQAHLSTLGAGKLGRPAGGDGHTARTAPGGESVFHDL
jgi:hypothetical protein